MDEMQSMMDEAPGRKFGTCGKGDKDRVRNKPKFEAGYSEIAWTPRDFKPGSFRKTRKFYK